MFIQAGAFIQHYTTLNCIAACILQPNDFHNKTFPSVNKYACLIHTPSHSKSRSQPMPISPGSFHKFRWDTQLQDEISESRCTRFQNIFFTTLYKNARVTFCIVFGLNNACSPLICHAPWISCAWVLSVQCYCGG